MTSGAGDLVCILYEVTLSALPRLDANPNMILAVARRQNSNNQRTHMAGIITAGRHIRLSVQITTRPLIGSICQDQSSVPW